MNISLQDKIQAYLDDILQGTDYFVLKVDISPKNEIKIYMDGDAGLPIDAISKINRSLYKKIEEDNIIPDNDFSLEVGSLGVDEPLILNRQYKKHIGRNMALTLEGKAIEGRLLDVSEEDITIEEITDKKKKTKEQHIIPFNTIQKAIVLISF